MEDHVKTMEKKLEAYNQKHELQNKRMEDTLGRLMHSLEELRTQMTGASTSHPHTGYQVFDQNSNRSFKFTPKLDFPKFDGNNPRMWIKKCSRYFELCKIANDQKVDLASLYMIDKAETWITSYLVARKGVEWDDFIIDLVARFRDDGASKVVEQFNKLQQTGQLEDYIDEFENIRSLMLQHNHALPDAYVLDSFIGGLKASVKPFVKAFKPVSIAEAIDYARLKEKSLTVSYKFSKPAANYSSTKASVPLLANTAPHLLPTPKSNPDSNAVK